MNFRSEMEQRFIKVIAILSFLCLGLFIARSISVASTFYFFIPENLALAWASLILASVLVGELAKRPWSSWQNILLTIAWIAFLPNSWYVMTDLIHIRPWGEVSQLYDVVLLSCLMICGFLLGFASLYLVHRELIKRMSQRRALVIIEAIILLSSFAIYLGRVLRWSTWDVITNPTGLILNITDRIVNPTAYSSSYSVTLLFFITISVMYLSFWILVQPLPKSGR